MPEKYLHKSLKVCLNCISSGWSRAFITPLAKGDIMFLSDLDSAAWQLNTNLTIRKMNLLKACEDIA